MKNLILITVTLLLTYSCSKNDDNDLVIKPGTTTFNVNNVAKTYTKDNYYYTAGGLSFLRLGDLAISFLQKEPTKLPSAFNMDSKKIILITYKINGKTYRANNRLHHPIGNINITITSHKDYKISGTFELTLVNKDDSSDSVVITEGVFKDIQTRFKYKIPKID